MKDSSYEIKIEKLTQFEVINHLEKSREDFTQREDSFLLAYSEKLSKYADFVTMRDKVGRLLGIIAFYCNVLPDAFISHVWINSELRGRGMANILLEKVECKCRLLGLKQIALEVLKSNHSAIRAYEKQGFAICEVRPDTFLMKKNINV